MITPARFDLKQTPGHCEFTLPIRTMSEANVSEPWQTRARRHREQKELVRAVLSFVRSKIPLPCTITMRRYGVRMLDAHDNLPISFKHILDHICAHITGDKRPGRADGYQGFTFKYEQEKSKDYFIKIIIDFSCEQSGAIVESRVG